MKLSILIATITERGQKFRNLRAKLLDQQADNVEVISICDNKEISIGSKRQKLLEMASGDYIVFIDDDDDISDNYVTSILANLGKDAVGFLIECTFNGTGKCMASASSKYKQWAEDHDGFKYVRSIYHKTPVRRELALQCGGFKDMRFGEDHDYSMRIMPLIKDENFINEVMYYYQYIHEEHNKKYGIGLK